MNRFIASCSILALGAAFISGAAKAQASTALSGSSLDRDVGLEEIVVTAQRRSDPLQRTPLAITALTPEMLQDRNIRTTQDLMTLVPSLTVTTQTAGNSGGSAVFYLRGMGQERAGNGTSPAVAIYIDDFYYPSLQGAIFDVLDLEQVEVLRGPQGTLFGRNTIGGAIRYTTKEPIFENAGDIQGTLGSYDRRDISAVANLAASDKVAVRLSAGRLRTDGFVDQQGGRDAGGTATDLVRAQLRVKPTENLDIVASGQYSRSRLDGYAVVTPGPFAPIPGTVPAIYNSTPAGIANPYDNRYVSKCDYCQSATTDRDQSIARFHSANVKANWDISEDLAAKVLIGWQRVVSDSETDLDGSPLPIYNNPSSAIDRASSQELQLNYKGFGDRLNLVSGLFHYDEQHREIDPRLSPQVILGGIRAQGHYIASTKTVAAFADGTFNLTDRFKVLGGLRYSRDDKDTDLTNSGVLTAQGAKVFPSTTWRAGVQMQWTPKVMSYATVSRGFRAGGFARTNIVGTTLTAFNPETATSYEAGTRAEFAGGTIRINPTVFYTRLSDIQVQDIRTSPAGTLIFVQNAAKAHSYGGELEAELAPTERLRLFSSLAYLRLQYDSIGPATSITLNSHFAHAPKFAYNVGANYTQPVDDDLKVVGTLNWSWTDDQYSAPEDLYQLHLPSYGVLNARLQLSSKKGWSAAVFGTNLTKEYYYVGGVDYQKSGTGAIRYDVGRPREFGVNLRFDF